MDANFLSRFFSGPATSPTPNVGGTTTGNAALALKMRPKYDDAVINGEIDPQKVPYEVWLQDQLKKPQLPAPIPKSPVLLNSLSR